MPKIRVLIVDDAIVIRRVLTDELSADPAIKVVGSAANGRIALSKMTQVNPDLVILDVEMPELDGLATLREIRKTYRQMPVIMFSALTERGASATLDALALGATDYFAKPAAGMEASLRLIREELIPQIKTLCGKSAVAANPALNKSAGSPMAGGPVRIIAIGTSTGGAECVGGIDSQAAGRLAGARCHRPAHAADVQAAATGHRICSRACDSHQRKRSSGGKSRGSAFPRANSRSQSTERNAARVVAA